eukprot:9477624-Pyramimonas_sp.AAC.2
MLLGALQTEAILQGAPRAACALPAARRRNAQNTAALHRPQICCESRQRRSPLPFAPTPGRLRTYALHGGDERGSVRKVACAGARSQVCLKRDGAASLQALRSDQWCHSGEPGRRSRQRPVRRAAALPSKRRRTINSHCRAGLRHLFEWSNGDLRVGTRKTEAADPVHGKALAGRLAGVRAARRRGWSPKGLEGHGGWCTWNKISEGKL